MSAPPPQQSAAQPAAAAPASSPAPRVAVEVTPEKHRLLEARIINANSKEVRAPWASPSVRGGANANASRRGPPPHQAQSAVVEVGFPAESRAVINSNSIDILTPAPVRHIAGTPRATPTH
jgi:hypothetical protein